MVTGTLVVHANGTFVFTPARDYSGPVPSVTYTVSSSDGTVTVSVLGITISPDVTGGIVQASTKAGTPITINLLANSPPAAGTTYVVASFSLLGSSTVYTPGPSAVPVVEPATGTLTGMLVVLANGSATFMPATGFTGPVPTVSYVVRSSYGQTRPASLVIIVAPGLPPFRPTAYT
jgi:hypothetical protein